jgi:GT2 family glycosyltransferase
VSGVLDGRLGPDSADGPPVDVSVVVVSYNAIEWLPRCLDAVEAAHRPSTSVEVVVVDNASGPEVQAYLADLTARGRPGLRVVQLQENLGYGRACNLGIRLSRGRLVMMLNPDAVLETGTIDALRDFHQADPGRGLVGGRTLRPDGALDPSSCWGAPTPWSWFCAAVGLSRLFPGSARFDPESLGGWARDTARDVDIVTGCLLLAAHETWDALGGYDPDYFMYGEDADLCRRAWASGLRPGITPHAVALHAVGASSPNRLGKQRLLLRGKATYARKNWAPLQVRLGLATLALHVGLRALAETALRRRDGMYRQLWAERRDVLAGWPPAPPEFAAARPGAPTLPAAA